MWPGHLPITTQQVHCLCLEVSDGCWDPVYQVIKCELLAIAYAYEYLHTYLCGHSFIIKIDRRPLEMITLKNLTAAPLHLQRMLLCLQQYDDTVIYMPDNEKLLLETLSKLFSLKQRYEMSLDPIVDHIASSDTRMAQAQSRPIAACCCPLTTG